MADESTFEEWALLELMGHRRLAGKVTAVQIAGASFLRIDVPGGGGADIATQYYAPGAVYAITPVTEDVARRFAIDHAPAPITRWELAEIEPTDAATDEGTENDEDRDW